MKKKCHAFISHLSGKTRKLGLEVAISPKSITPMAPVELSAGYTQTDASSATISTSFKRLVVRGAEVTLKESRKQQIQKDIIHALFGIDKADLTKDRIKELMKQEFMPDDVTNLRSKYDYHHSQNKTC